VNLLAVRSLFPIKIGLFFVVTVWFCFLFYRFSGILLSGVEVPFTDLPATIGLGFRVFASGIVLIITVFYLFKQNFSLINFLSYLRLAILFEVIYWLSFLPSGIWGFSYSTIQYSPEFFILNTGLPCTIQSIMIPFALMILITKMTPQYFEKKFIKWSLIAVSIYLFVFWFNYTTQWWSEIFVSGTELILQSNLYTLQFILTVCGLLCLFLYSLIFVKNSLQICSIKKLDLKTLGLIITLFGIYFDLLLIMWLLFPVSDGVLTVWPVYSIEYNPDLWLASIPIFGVPLIFIKSKKNNKEN